MTQNKGPHPVEMPSSSGASFTDQERQMVAKFESRVNGQGGVE